jgi:hypothetical protein
MEGFMLVKVNTSLAGSHVSYRPGEVVEADVFASLVGTGWEALCDPVEVLAPEVEDVSDVETSTVTPVMEMAVRLRRGRK